MGFRMYLAEIDKKRAFSMKSMSLSEIQKSFIGKQDLEFISFPSIFDLVDNSIIQISIDSLYETFPNFFVLDDVLKESEDCDVIMKDISKTELLKIIEHYEKEIAGQYEIWLKEIDNSINTGDMDSLYRLKFSLRSRFNDWNSKFSDEIGFSPLNIDEKSKNISRSELFEYDSFELVRLLKYFDFENKNLVFIAG